MLSSQKDHFQKSKFIYEDIKSVDNPNKLEDGSEGVDVYFTPLSKMPNNHLNVDQNSMNRTSNYQLTSPRSQM